MNKTVSPITMFIVAAISLAVSAIVLNNITKAIVSNPKIGKEDYESVFWFFRVVTALAASAISISIPGMLKVEYNNGTFIAKNSGQPPMTLTEQAPKIIAGGAMAVFVLVYLFSPLS